MPKNTLRIACPLLFIHALGTKGRLDNQNAIKMTSAWKQILIDLDYPPLSILYSTKNCPNIIFVGTHGKLHGHFVKAHGKLTGHVH